MRAMNKYQRNLGIIAYPQQFGRGHQFGAGKEVYMAKIAQAAANTVGRHLGKSKVGQKLMTMAKSKLGRNLIRLAKSRTGRKFAKMTENTLGRQLMKSDMGRKLLKMAKSRTGRRMIKSAKKSIFNPTKMSFGDVLAPSPPPPPPPPPLPGYPHINENIHTHPHINENIPRMVRRKSQKNERLKLIYLACSKQEGVLKKQNSTRN